MSFKIQYSIMVFVGAVVLSLVSRLPHTSLWTNLNIIMLEILDFGQQ